MCLVFQLCNEFYFRDSTAPSLFRSRQRKLVERMWLHRSKERLTPETPRTSGATPGRAAPEAATLLEWVEKEALTVWMPVMTSRRSGYAYYLYLATVNSGCLRRGYLMGPCLAFAKFAFFMTRMLAKCSHCSQRCLQDAAKAWCCVTRWNALDLFIDFFKGFVWNLSVHSNSSPSRRSESQTPVKKLCATAEAEEKLTRWERKLCLLRLRGSLTFIEVLRGGLFAFETRGRGYRCQFEMR